MSEYWKSTPSYWCKFCSQYVRDTGIERKNHEATAKHQNNIQRSLRELHKGKEREDREKQRAKDEVARLNGMFSGDKGAAKPAPSKAATASKAPAAAPSVATAQQRRAHAEQLAALGVELPDELKKEVTGVGNYQVVNEREVQQTGSVSVNRSLADILAEAKREEEQSKENSKKEERDEAESKGVHKRKAEDDDDIRDEEAAPKQRRAWGSNLKTYPGNSDAGGDTGDLDALLSGIKKPKAEESDSVKKEERGEDVKGEAEAESSKALSEIPDINEEGKDGTESATAIPAVVFKTRKGKK